MRAALAFVILMLLFALACADERQNSTEPTAPGPSLNTAEAPAPPPMAGATVCLSYGRDRELVRAKLNYAPTDEKLQKELESLEALILDAC